MPHQRRKLAHVPTMSTDKKDFYECEACNWYIDVRKGDTHAARIAFDAHDCTSH
jgi:hypothetical protein